MLRERLRRPRLVLALAVAVALVAAAHASSSSAGSAQSPGEKLRGDLAALVSGEQGVDPRLPGLVPAYQPGEIAYFAVLTEPDDATHQAAVAALGARVLRAYRSIDALALASSPTTVLRVAALPWVAWLAPVEVVMTLNHQREVDQSRATTADVGAPPAWNEGVTGKGIRIAVLDTGLDPAHPDLDDLDFRHWDSPLNPRKVVDARNFVGGACAPLASADGHGHGTHVAGIAAGTGEGTPLAGDDGKYAGVAPDAELAVAKVLTDAGTGLNSDLVAAMEWAAMPADPAACSIGADIVNISLGSEARPTRLNSDGDVDFVGYALDRLAVRYGTLFVAAAGNSGPFLGSVLEAPGSAAQALSVGAAAKDYDVNHDDTLSGDTCAGWSLDPPSGSPLAQPCGGSVGSQPPSIASLSSRGPSGDVWLRPDLVAPGYNIVSAQASTGTAIASNDLNLGTRGDPLYATATGTSMAAPATAGSAALVLQAYRSAYGGSPSGASGLPGLRAPASALLRAALMNTAGPDLDEARWILTTDLASLILMQVRNGPTDPYVGPLAEGAGKLNVGRAIAALRDGVVVYSAASGSGADAGTGHRDLQGSWQVGAIAAGGVQTQQFVVHAAPGAGPVSVAFSFEPGRPSDGSSSLPSVWVSLPGTVSVPRGGDGLVQLGLSVPTAAPAGSYTGRVVARVSNGQTLRIPVFASVSLHDPDPAADNAPGAQARFVSAHDVFAKDDTSWPSVVGTPGTGANADWLVFPVELAGDLSEARFSVYDADRGDETYDLYLYDANLDLVASTHPFAAAGVTDAQANDARGPSTQASPQVLSLRTPAAGRHYLAVNRAKIGGTTSGDFGAFVLGVDEIRAAAAAQATTLGYEGDFLFTQGEAGRLAARLTDGSGAPIGGRRVTFSFDDPPVGPCPGGTCSALTDYRGLAQVATDPIVLAPGVHELHVAFAGDSFWQPSAEADLVLVVGTEPPGAGTGGKVTAGGWFVPDGLTAGKGNEGRVHFAFHAEGGTVAPSGELRYRDRAAGVDLALVAYTALVVDGDQATLTGSVRRTDGGTESFDLTVRDGGEPGRGHDTIRFRLPQSGYERSGTLGGGNIEVHRG